MSKKRKHLNPPITVQPAGKVKSIAFANPLEGKTKWLAFFGFLVLSFLLYFQCLPYGYVLDDKIVISENNFTKQGFAGIWNLLSTDSFQGYFGEQQNLVQGGRYRPLSLVTFAIEHQFFGLNYKLSHFINILLYGISGFVSFVTLRLIFKEKAQELSIIYTLSFLAALVFMVHPIHTEAVANIKGRDEVMAFLFSMLTLLYSVKYFDSHKIWQLFIALICFLLGFLSKENTITFLAVVPFSLILFRTRNFKYVSIITASLLLVAIGYLAIRYQVMGFLMNENPSKDIMNNPFYGMDLNQKFGTIFYTLLVYLKLSFFPIELTHDYYPYHIPISTFGDLRVILSLLIQLLLIGAGFYFWKRNKAITFAIGFYFICLSIVSNFVVDVGTFMNERFIFTASLGICLMIVLLLKSLNTFIPKGKSNRSLLLLLAPIILLFSFKTLDRVQVWENEMTLNQASIKVSKNSARANSFMATAYFNRYKEINDREEKIKLLQLAVPYAERALEIYPTYLNGNLMKAGIAAEQLKYDYDINKMLNTFKEVIRQRPDVDYVTTYLKYLNDKPQYYNALLPFYVEVGQSILLEEKRNLTWSIHYLLISLEAFPNDQNLRRAIVKAYTAAGKPDQAEKFK